MGEVADVVDDHRTAVAAFVPGRTEHEVVQDQLSASFEQIEQAGLAVRALEDVILLDPDHGQPPALGSERIPRPCRLLFLGEQLVSQNLPLAW